MGDSQSRKFGDSFLDKLGGQLKQKAPVFNKSLFVGAGTGTQDAWNAGTDFAAELNRAGGFGPTQQEQVQYLGSVFSGYGSVADDNGLTGAQANAMTGLGGLGAKYAAMGGLSAGQAGNMAQLAALNPAYAQIGANGGLTTGQAGNVDTSNAVASGFGSVAVNGGLSAAQQAAMSKTSGLGNAYAGLSGAYDQDNPAFKLVRQKALDDAVKNVGAGFTQSGRFGGGSYIDDATDAAVTAIAPLDYEAYQLGVDNKYRSLDSQKGIEDTLFAEGQAGTGNRLAGLSGQLGASGQAFAQGQQGTQNRLASLAGQEGFASTLFGMDQAGRDNTVRALEGQRGVLGDQFNMGQAGIGNTLAGLGGQAAAAGQMFGMGQAALDNRQAATDALGQIGAARDADAQGARLGEADLFDRTQNAELDRLAKIGAIFGDPTAAANEAPWWQQALGWVADTAGNAIGRAFG